jgi:peptide/nickel transport system ATP-binding protein
VSLTSEQLDRYPHQLSGGQQQRAALGIAFACRPALVVLDEPTTGLDVTTQRRILETVRSLCEAYGVAAVYVSHDLAVVEGLASTVSVMYAGRVIESGSVSQVFSDPVHPYTRGLCAAVPSAEEAHTLVGLEGNPPRPGRRPAGCPFAPRCPHVLPACRESEPELRMIADRLVRCRRGEEIGVRTESLRRPVTPPIGSDRGILRATQVNAWYGHVPVLHDVTFEVPERSCTAIVGQSGSGKSTLASCISGLHTSFNGTIEFEGVELAPSARRRPQETRRRARFVFQNPYTALNPRKTVAELIEQPLRHFFRIRPTERAERVSRALSDVWLSSDVAEAYPDELSGGERQRVAIARALVVQPTLLICDEVTSSLDVSAQALIIELLRQLQRERDLTLLFITHNLALVRALADKVIVMASGRVIESGSTGAVMDAPRHEYTVNLMNDIPKFSG